MRPTVARLPLKAPSLDLLRYLSGQSIHHCSNTSTQQREPQNFTRTRRRTYATSVTVSAGHDDGAHPSQTMSLGGWYSAPPEPKPKRRHEEAWPTVRNADPSFVWKEDSLSSEEWEFESNLGEISSRGRRLVDQPAQTQNISLWICLLEFRQRRYGTKGVCTVWEAILRRSVKLPVGHAGNRLWTAFTNVALTDKFMMVALIKYADELFDTTGHRWPRLYSMIVQHAILQKDLSQAQMLHDRLIQRHVPSCKHILDMLDKIIHRDGPEKSLFWVYHANSSRNAYSTIIPKLVGRQEFVRAARWHHRLLQVGDTPPSSEVTAPLIKHFAIYDVNVAKSITTSLVNAGVIFPEAMKLEMQDNRKISREIMNLIHGRTLDIPEWKYNDSVVSRWFATRWISLDVAFAAVHALGIIQIGPLAMQAIGLREPEPLAFQKRIQHLRDIGISVESSNYTKAIVRMAASGDAENLTALLENDLLPTAYDDHKLQDSLMEQYIREGRMDKYRLLLAVRTASSGILEKEHQNVALRIEIKDRDHRAALTRLDVMRQEGTVVTTRSIKALVINILRPRARGRRPQSHLVGEFDDVALAIRTLGVITESNSFVPLLTWREILRRLGMEGRLDELDQISLYLAQWYKSNSTLRMQTLSLASSVEANRYLIPNDVQAAHPLHPLAILFTKTFQRAIVEWGFIHTAVNRTPRMHLSLHTPIVPLQQRPSAPYLRGIRLLQQLRAHGVAIDAGTVRSAVYSRLEVLFGPGESKRSRNRRIRERGTERMDTVVRNVNNAWGSNLMESVEVLRQRMQSDWERRVVREAKKRDAMDMEIRVEKANPDFEG